MHIHHITFFNALIVDGLQKAFNDVAQIKRLDYEGGHIGITFSPKSSPEDKTKALIREGINALLKLIGLQSIPLASTEVSTLYCFAPQIEIDNKVFFLELEKLANLYPWLTPVTDLIIKALPTYQHYSELQVDIPKAQQRLATFLTERSKPVSLPEPSSAEDSPEDAYISLSSMGPLQHDDPRIQIDLERREVMAKQRQVAGLQAQYQSAVFDVFADYDECFARRGAQYLVYPKEQHPAVLAAEELMNINLFYLRFYLQQRLTVTNVLISRGTNRHNAAVELQNAMDRGNALSLNAYEGLTDRFREQLHKQGYHAQVEHDPLFLSDVLNGKAPGETYREFQVAVQLLTTTVPPESWKQAKFFEECSNDASACLPTNHNKLILLYLRAHFLAKRYPGQLIIISFLDDNMLKILSDFGLDLEQLKLLLPQIRPLPVPRVNTIPMPPRLKPATTPTPAAAAAAAPSSAPQEECFLGSPQEPRTPAVAYPQTAPAAGGMPAYHPQLGDFTGSPQEPRTPAVAYPQTAPAAGGMPAYHPQLGDFTGSPPEPRPPAAAHPQTAPAAGVMPPQPTGYPATGWRQPPAADPRAVMVSATPEQVRAAAALLPSALPRVMRQPPAPSLPAAPPPSARGMPQQQPTGYLAPSLGQPASAPASTVAGVTLPPCYTVPVAPPAALQPAAPVTQQQPKTIFTNLQSERTLNSKLCGFSSDHDASAFSPWEKTVVINFNTLMKSRTIDGRTNNGFGANESDEEYRARYLVNAQHLREAVDYYSIANEDIVLTLQEAPLGSDLINFMEQFLENIHPEIIPSILSQSGIVKGPIQCEGKLKGKNLYIAVDPKKIGLVTIIIQPIGKAEPRLINDIPFSPKNSQKILVVKTHNGMIGNIHGDYETHIQSDVRELTQRAWLEKTPLCAAGDFNRDMVADLPQCSLPGVGLYLQRANLIYKKATQRPGISDTHDGYITFNPPQTGHPPRIEQLPGLNRMDGKPLSVCQLLEEKPPIPICIPPTLVTPEAAAGVAPAAPQVTAPFALVAVTAPAAVPAVRSHNPGVYSGFLRFCLMGQSGSLPLKLVGENQISFVFPAETLPVNLSTFSDRLRSRHYDFTQNHNSFTLTINDRFKADVTYYQDLIEGQKSAPNFEQLPSAVTLTSLPADAVAAGAAVAPPPFNCALQ